jgi:hypothetical protein
MITAIGCGDELTTRIAREAADRQAQQNTAMAELNKQVATGTRDLVSADAQARTDVLRVHHDLQAERMRLDSGWSSLEEERRQLAMDRRTQSILAPFGTIVATVILVTLVLGFCWYALVAIRRDDGGHAELNELLLAELLPEQRTQLTGEPLSRPLLGESSPQSLP